MLTTSSAAIRAAMRRYDSGERPFRFNQPRTWYVVGSSGRIYPLKYVFATAVLHKPSEFHTAVAIREVLRLGFDVRKEPKDEETEFQKQVRASLKNSKARAARLAKAPRIPRRVIREVVKFERNPDVVAEVLLRANGCCERCRNPAPFRKRADRTPYLEVHHRIQLADGGEDTVENAIALCPNCHRRAHHG